MRLILRLTLCFVLLVGVAIPALAPVPFTHIIIDANVRGFDCKAVGDLDGDGFIDLVVGGNNPAGGGVDLFWYRYPTWQRFRVATGQVEFTTDMQVGDVDNDGDLDIIIPDGPGPNNIVWYENPRPTASPTILWTRRLIGTHNAFGHDLEVGDINGDGKLDVVARKDVTTLFLQDTPTSWTRVDLSARVPVGEGLALADLDRDGDDDIIVTGRWLETPTNPLVPANWVVHPIDPTWTDQVGIAIGDINKDGRLDVLFAPSESTAGKLSWYEAPPNPRTGIWIEHVIDPSVDFVHTFKTADINKDGHLDVVWGEMSNAGSRRRVGFYLNEGGGATWTQQVVATTGTHNLRVGDIGADGDIDIFGSNWQGPPVEMWVNQLSSALPLNRWTYIQVDNARDPTTPFFGLAMGNLRPGGLKDIVAGPFFYRNPGGTMAGAWPRVALPGGVDAMLIVPDVDGSPGVIAESLPSVFWLKPADAQGNSWTSVQIGTLPPTSHGNGQGYAVAQIIPGGKPEILLAAGAGEIYYFQIPANPAAGNWPRTLITLGATEEGIGVGDMDRDGDVDIAAGATGGTTAAWWENPGNGAGNWVRHTIGPVVEFADRFAVADMNRDGRPDVIVSEETPLSGASVYWFEQPTDPTSPNWTRHTVVTQFTTNSMDVADMDLDGDMDVITGEHRGPLLKVAVWANINNAASFVENVVSTARESHLGARVADVDNDGDLDIASIAFDNPQFLHLWRNDAISTGTDTTPPTVSITSPAPGATVSGTISVTATATDDVGVVGVQFRVDGNNIGAEDTVAPYSASLNTMTLANGSHVLTAVARDAAGNSTTSAGVTVNVNNTGPPPNPLPNISSIAPSVRDVGSVGFNLQVTGTEFISGSKVRVNGNDRPTTFSSATSLTAAIPASDVAASGALQITAFNPAPGGGTSNVMNLAVSDYALGSQTAPQTVTAGQSANYTITVSAQNGPYSGQVTLACSNLPARASCTFSPASVAPGGGAVNSTLTISTTASSGAMVLGWSPGRKGPRRLPLPHLGLFSAVLAFALLALQASKQRRLAVQALPAVLLVLLALQVAGCAGVGAPSNPPSPPPSPGTPPGTYTVTISGTSGTVQRTTTVTLTVR